MPATDHATLAVIAQSVDIALALVGCVLIWQQVLSGGARTRRRPSPLTPWEAPLSDFFMFVLTVFSGYFAVGLAATLAARALGLVDDALMVFGGAGGQLGMLLGFLAYRLSYRRSAPAPVPPPHPNVFLTGLATFLMTLPVILAASALWELLLRKLGLPVNKQDSIEIFMRSESRWLVATMIILATVAAPVTEELVFRAGLFRYFRTRLPRVAAYLLPAIPFAAMHVNWSSLVGLASFLPLTMLAVVFSFAYERTGRIGTTIVAHALFNLNSLLLIFAGAGREQ